MNQALQDKYAPNSICFGCGPKNELGLKIKSIAQVDGSTTATFKAAAHHEAFPGMLNGGIIGSLLDCHSNWTAAYALMKKTGMDFPPCTVTADFHVKLRRPTPLSRVVLRARILETIDDRCIVEATLEADGKVTATCRGTFVAVKEGHPAYHRW